MSSDSSSSMDNQSSASNQPLPSPNPGTIDREKIKSLYNSGKEAESKDNWEKAVEYYSEALDLWVPKGQRLEEVLLKGFDKLMGDLLLAYGTALFFDHATHASIFGDVAKKNMKAVEEQVMKSLDKTEPTPAQPRVKASWIPSDKVTKPMFTWNAAPKPKPIEDEEEIYADEEAARQTAQKQLPKFSTSSSSSSVSINSIQKPSSSSADLTHDQPNVQASASSTSCTDASSSTMPPPPSAAPKSALSAGQNVGKSPEEDEVKKSSMDVDKKEEEHESEEEGEFSEEEEGEEGGEEEEAEGGENNYEEEGGEEAEDRENDLELAWTILEFARHYFMPHPEYRLELSDVHFSLGSVAWEDEKPQEAQAEFEKCLQYAKEAGDRRAQAQALTMLATVHETVDETTDEAVKLLQEARQLIAAEIVKLAAAKTNPGAVAALTASMKDIDDRIASFTELKSNPIHPDAPEDMKNFKYTYTPPASFKAPQHFAKPSAAATASGNIHTIVPKKRAAPTPGPSDLEGKSTSTDAAHSTANGTSNGNNSSISSNIEQAAAHEHHPDEPAAKRPKLAEE